MPEAGLRIQDVADRVGLSVRTIRLYQTEGLVPPPRRHGRTALYDPEHVARLEVIAELRAQGFGLAAIRRTLESGVDVGRLRGLIQAAREGHRPEPPRPVAPEDLQPAGGEPLTPDIARWAAETGLYRPRPDGLVDVVCPPLHEAGQDLGRMGVPWEHRRHIADELIRHAEAIARAQVETVYEQVLRPLLEPADGGPPRLDEAAEALERLRPLAAKAVAGYFPIAMTKAIDELVQRELGGGSGEA